MVKKRGFTKVCDGINADPRLTPSEFRILVYLSMFATAYPSRYAIANATGIGMNTVDKVLATLERLGVIVRYRRAYRTTLYRVQAHSLWRIGESRDQRCDVGTRAEDMAQARKAKDL